MSLRRGDLSAPVLAIIVTIGLISAGLVIMAWFWWLAPQLGRMGSLVVIGTPVFMCMSVDSSTGECTSGSFTITVKNIGNAPVTITKIVTPYFVYTYTETVEAGRSADLIFGLSGVLPLAKPIPAGVLAFEGVIISDAGTYTFTAVVIWS